MSTQGRPTADQIKRAAESAQLSLTDEEAKKLEGGGSIRLEESADNIRTVRGCSGIKIVDLGRGCGIYLIPFPPQVTVCCET